MRTYKLILVVISICIFLPERPRAQFISQDANKGSYLNYSGRNYENYSSVLLRRKFYDNFGNFLVDGVAIFGLSELQRPATSIFDAPTSDITKSRFYSSYFSNLVILNDSYSGLTSRLMIGDAIRTKFTSLTLDKARFNGVRWDASSPKYRGTLLAARVSDPVRFNPEIVLQSPNQIRRQREWTQYLLGGHFETDIGDILTLGATYVNQHQRRSTVDTKNSSIKGVVSNAVPRVIFVQIKDDTPGDNSGPIIFSTPQISINGRAVPMTNINGRSPDPAKVDVRFPIQYWIINNYSHFYVATYPARDTVSQTDYVYYRDKSSQGKIPTYPYQLPSDRKDVDYNLTFAYVIPPDVNQVDFSVILGNDYRVDASHDWINNVDEYTDRPFRPHGDSLVTGLLAAPTFFRTMVRADGNVKDGSNKRVVIFSYGLVSGMAVYGMNFKLNYGGFNIEGEFVRSAEYLKYPINPGARFESPGEAFFIRGTKKVGRVTFGGERYRLDPGYTTFLNIYTMDNSYYGDQNAPIAPEFLGFDPSSPVTGTFISTSPSNYVPGRAGGAVYSLVDDNDDNDRWEDGFYHYNVRPTVDIRNGDVVNYNYRLGIPGFGDPFLRGYRQNSNELVGLGDIIRRPDAGIFPGRDKDRDGIPDDDRNSDGIPDYLQDFLTYYTDPPFFLFGDDWNNNGVIDELENDILPDYPYNPDLDGYHLFGAVELLRGMNVRTGTIRERGIAQGGKNFTDYIRWNYEAGTPRFGNINLFYAYKRTHDNIPNNGYQFLAALTINSTVPDFVFDPLEYKNSRVHQLYLGTVYTQIPGVRIENNIKYEHNTQFAIGEGQRNTLGQFINPDEQKDGLITKQGIVNKIDYTYGLFNNRLLLIPQLKIRRQKVVQFLELPTGQKTSTVTTHIKEVLPIFRIDYQLTDRTSLRLGLQGIPGVGSSLAYQIRNIQNPFFDENRTTYAVTLSNKSSYGGYNVVVDFGLKATKREFPHQSDPKDLTNRTTLVKEESLIFMTVYAGF